MIARRRYSFFYLGTQSLGIAMLLLMFGGMARAQDFQLIYAFPSGGIELPTFLMQAADGSFYGTTLIAPNGPYTPSQAIFKMTPSGSVTQAWIVGDPTIMQAGDGTLYVTGGGLPQGAGIYTLDSTGALTVVHAFDAATEGRPVGPLAEALDGNFYGTASGGGSPYGAIYRMAGNGTVTVMHSFTGADGSNPCFLIPAADGSLYGYTCGSDTDPGLIFRMGLDGTVAILHQFTGVNGDGAVPTSLVQGRDGFLYGTTLFGGTGYGTVFRLTPDGILTILHTFDGAVDGGYADSLIQTSDGSLYGTSNAGVFQIDTAGTFTFYPMDPSAGVGPAKLIHSRDGDMYGVAGGLPGGTIFRFHNPSPCDDALALGYSGGTLDLRFTVKATTPAFFGTWLAFNSTVTPLWTVSIPAVTPAAYFDVPINAFPSVGDVGVLTALVTNDLRVCTDWRIMYTGGSGATLAALSRALATIPLQPK